MRYFLLISAICLYACGSHTVTPVGGDDCKAACLNFERLECPEAASGGDTCTVTCEKIVKRRLIAFDPSCVANANSVETVRSCPNVRCPR